MCLKAIPAENMMNVAIIGSSQVGKSTLIRRIAGDGLMFPTNSNPNQTAKISFKGIVIKMIETNLDNLTSFDSIVIVITLETYEQAAKIREAYPNKNVVIVLSKRDLVPHYSNEAKLINLRLGGTGTIHFSGLSLYNQDKILEGIIEH